MTHDEQEIRRDIIVLADRLRGAADGFPWLDVKRDASHGWESAWWWWNVGFVRAAGRLCHAVQVLDEAQLYDETNLPLRSLAELVANQGYMARDPERRAVEFAEADLSSRERLLTTLESLGAPLRFPEGAITRVRDEIAQVRHEMADALGPLESPDERRPFGRSARNRMEAAGLEWHYDGLYAGSSDFVHMGARAIAGYIGRIVEDRPEAPATAKILLACQLLLRSLFFGDAALELGRREDLSDYAREYIRIGLPNSDPERALRDLWPPSVEVGKQEDVEK
jgi:hypothetical protein